MELKHIFDKYGLTADQFHEFEDLFEFHQMERDETVFTEGDESDTFFFVKAGELAVSRFEGSRQESVIGILEQGELFGEIGLLNDSPRTATVRTLTSVQLYSLNKESFFHLLRRNEGFRSFLDKLNIQRMLQGVPLFRNLGQDALDRIRRIVVEVDAKEGEVLAEAGSLNDALYIIQHGSARAIQTRSDGREIPLDQLHAGANFGEQGLIHRRHHEFRRVAAESVRMLVIKTSKFRQLLRKFPDISFNIEGSGFLTKMLPFFYNKMAYLAVPALAMNRPKMITWIMLLVTAMLSTTAALPSIWPDKFPMLNSLAVDTDPENMLAADEPARVYHNQMKIEMTLHEMVVLGVVNEHHPDGAFNVDTLRRVHALSEFAKGLRWPSAEDENVMEGVIAVDMMTPSTMDVVEQTGPGSVRFSWLMRDPPTTREAALDVFQTLKRYPMMADTMVSRDGKALSLYLPLTSKDVSHRVYVALNEYIETLDGDDEYFITGLPVAEDSFGIEMFFQMAVSAPLAMLVIFLLMLFFFRNLTLVISPMIVAMVSVMCTMALLIISGNTLHIMSSMIPIFIMPIAVLDSVHILSEFFDYYPRIKDRRLTIQHVMRELFTPMLYTSVTTAMGFASLALVPIPPVQVFGIFVGIGVVLAWLLSISFIPAYILLIPQHKLDSLVANRESGGSGSRLPRFLQGVFAFTQKRPRAILLVALMLVGGCLYGVQQIVVNDNPIRWFAEDHPIRVADRLLNEHFAGTYMAYLALEAPQETGEIDAVINRLKQAADDLIADQPAFVADAAVLVKQARAHALTVEGPDGLLDYLAQEISDRLDSADDDDTFIFWEDMLDRLEDQQQVRQVFKDPEVLAWIEQLQVHLASSGIVGKSVSVADIAKTINRELRGGGDEHYVLPQSRRGVAQTLLTYQSGHRPQDLWRFVTPDYRTASIWLLLNSGDNRDMAKVVDGAEAFMQDNPPPGSVKPGWFGLTYINVVWQEKMVQGMSLSIMGSYLTVLLLMTMLLRSLWWGLLAMVPLSATMLIIYGVLGLIGKPYDMPVAVLSALAIGLSVDFTIHFLVRTRHFMSQIGDWKKALAIMFTEPAQAIFRNILVVAIGFLPLLAAPLVPYNTVGNLIATILVVSGLATLVILSAGLTVWNKKLFSGGDGRRTTLFCCPDSVFVGGVAAVLLALTLRPYLDWDWDNVIWYLIASVAPMMLALLACGRLRTAPEYVPE